MTNMVILIQEATSHSKKIKHRWEHVLEIKKKNHVMKSKVRITLAWTYSTSREQS